MGRAWYEDGKLLKKKNTFEDFIACAESLVRLACPRAMGHARAQIKSGVTSPARLAVCGRSAGAHAAGAVVAGGTWRWDRWVQAGC